MLLQPLKVFAAATFIALIIKDPNKLGEGDKSDSKPEVVEQVRLNLGRHCCGDIVSCQCFVMFPSVGKLGNIVEILADLLQRDELDKFVAIY